MNFNFFVLLLLIIITSCGVKSAPITPKENVLPSILSPYLDDHSQEQELNSKQDESF